MASGALDVNGIWQYGESDLEATFSELLNVGQEATSLAVAALKTRATSLETSRSNPTVFVAGSSAARDSHWGSPANATQRRALQDLGATTIRLDTGWAEQYFAGLTDGGANPGGVTTAGWYPTFGRMPFANFARKPAAALNVPNNTVTDVTAATYWDITRSGFAAPAGTIVAPYAGVYRFEVGSRWAANAVGTREIFVNKNNATYTTNPLMHPAMSAAVAVDVSGAREITLAAADALRVFYYQSSGGALLVDTTADLSWITCRYVGPK